MYTYIFIKEQQQFLVFNNIRNNNDNNNNNNTIIITIQLIKLNFNDTNLMKAINCRLVSVGGYVMHVCVMTRNDLEKLDKIVKKILKIEGFYGKKTSDKQLCTKNKDCGRRLWCFIEIYKETKVKAVCYMATSTNGITTNGGSKPRS